MAEARNALRIVSLSIGAEARGLRRGMGQADARALCPDLRTELLDPGAETMFHAGLRRWAQRYSPWVGDDEDHDGMAQERLGFDARNPRRDMDRVTGQGALALDITGCAHLFGGEAEMLEEIRVRLLRMGLSAQLAAADSKGAAWALARFGQGAADQPVIAAAGDTRAAISSLPLQALRLESAAIEGLTRLGVKTVGEMVMLPRASLARRFGAGTVRRLDQALGAEAEPVGPRAPAPLYAARLSLPEPIGLTADLRAGLDRLLARLCARLEQDGRGARRLRLSLRRVDRSNQSVEVALARPGRDPGRIAPLFEKAIDTLEAGFGIDALRLHAVQVEALSARQTHAGPDHADPRHKRDALDDLLTRLGARIGFERITRLTPAESHLPEKAFTVASAAYSEPAANWRAWAAARPSRPLNVFAPEPVIEASPETASPPQTFRWRAQTWRVAAAIGPERIAPEWWLDDPEWRSGLRDYWRVETSDGRRLWLFRTPQAEPPGWFVAGEFA
ncbi:MAG: DNA polymerase Y family protein [Pseudomonadota bacterium]